MAEQLPIARDIFPTMLHWVAINTDMVGNRLRWSGKSMRMVDRVNFAARSARYPWTAVWSNDTATRAERQWWIEWGREYNALADRDGEGMVRLVDLALARLRDPQPGTITPPVQEPPVTCGPMGPAGEDEEEGPGTKSKDPFGDDFDKDPDGDESDEDGDEDGDDGEWGDDPDADEPSPSQPGVEDEDEPESDDDDGSDVDAPDTGDGEGKDGEPDGESNDEPEGEGGDDVGDEADDDKPRTFPQDFDAHDLQGDVDRVNRGEDNWRAQDEGALLQRVMDVDASTERIATTKWGTAKVEVRSIEQLSAQRRR